MGNRQEAKNWWQRLFPGRSEPESGPPAQADDLETLARKVGRNWVKSKYFDNAEPDMKRQWDGLIYPFIRDCDFSSVVDLAAGHGRNSEMLRTMAGKIYVVDINVENIDFCRERFAGNNLFTFVTNNGIDLSGLGDASITLVYCFDAMVHFDSDVVRAYLKEFKRVLKPGGRAFCHHSNYTKNPGGNIRDNPAWRNFMSESLMAHFAIKEGLKVVRTKIVPWGETEGERELDCFTLLEKDGLG
jgi:ubiquinone/menaquinone biosynthesis C-methylase UbiE